MEFIKFTKEILEKELLATVRELGREIGVKAPAAVKSKQELIQSILNIQSGKEEPVPRNKRGAPPKTRIDISRFLIAEIPEDMEFPQFRVSNKIEFHDSHEISEGVLEIHKDGYGFVRVKNYESSKEDVHVNSQLIRKYNLRRGDLLKVVIQRKSEKEAPTAQDVITINFRTPEELGGKRVLFEDLVPCHPIKRITLENDFGGISSRCIDLFCPIGFGQRGLVVAPPKTGKTTLLKEIARSIECRYPATKVIVLLIDERPEEVTDFKREIMSEVVYSTFDEGEDHHIRVAELVLNRAKRMVEHGNDVVILLDSITRLARAYNTQVESSGKTLSGGLDPVALQGPKRFLGAARKVEHGGSLTIIATALVETESRMDEVIFEEFKGTGNMELRLSRSLSESRVFPAIDLYKSGTRKDELLLTQEELGAVSKLRKILSQSKDATENLLEMMKRTKNNQEFISKLDAWLEIYNK